MVAFQPLYRRDVADADAAVSEAAAPYEGSSTRVQSNHDDPDSLLRERGTDLLKCAATAFDAVFGDGAAAAANASRRTDKPKLLTLDDQ